MRRQAQAYLTSTYLMSVVDSIFKSSLDGSSLSLILNTSSPVIRVELVDSTICPRSRQVATAGNRL
jgi:hypothetical protein